MSDDGVDRVAYRSLPPSLRLRALSTRRASSTSRIVQSTDAQTGPRCCPPPPDPPHPSLLHAASEPASQPRIGLIPREIQTSPDSATYACQCQTMTGTEVLGAL
jgi:hypothetical protein